MKTLVAGSQLGCACEPPGTTDCGPTSNGQGCLPVTCPNSGETCLPHCIKVAATGQQTVVDCQCMPDTHCHIAMGVALPFCQGSCPPGFTCITTSNFDPTDSSTTYCCDCQPDNTTCAPLPDGSACRQVQCPVAGEQCQPKCILIDNQGLIEVDSCECGSPTDCHAEIGTTGPVCVGNCPPGYTCVQRVVPTPNGTEYCCECVADPPACEPTSDGTACVPFQCPITGETCSPRCITWLPGTTQYTVIDCDCRGANDCHVVFTPGAAPSCQGNCPPGYNCVQNSVQNADGTISVCCDCVKETCDCLGDVNGDGLINGLDIAGFIRCFLGAPLPGDNCACADMDGNGLYTNNDINLFVQLLLTQPSQGSCAPTLCCPKADLSLNLGTGVDANGNLIPIGSNDDDWVVTVDASGGSVPRLATVVTPHPAWLTIPGTRWISANYYGPNGLYDYEFCFCLDDRYTNPTLTVQVRADDACQVFLNGNFIGNGASFGAATPATLTTNNPAFFHAGQNCVQVEVANIGGPPTGLNLAGTVTATDGRCCCPPADLAKSVDSGVYDNGGGLIPVGSNDDTWTVTLDASGGITPRPAEVINPHPAWAIIPGTQWIAAAQYGPNGLYIYQYCFCLDPRFKNATLTLDLLADDSATVWLNGTQVGATPSGWAFLNPPTHVFVTNQALFKPCENCIEITVTNSGGVVTGLDVTGQITAVDGLCCDDRQLSCCLHDGLCIDMAPGVEQCPLGGSPMLGPCQNSRACCLPDGSCQSLEPRCCERAGGHVMPVGSTCGGSLQACCITNAAGGTSCVNVDPLCCTSIYGGVPKGPGTVCLGDHNGNGIDDACEPPPPACGPDPTTGTCKQVQCPITGQQCLPTCVVIDPATQVVLQILSCDCIDPASCHIQLSPAPTTASCVGTCPPGYTCRSTVTNNADGTQTMCCQCVPTVTLCPLGTSLGSQLCQARQQVDCQTQPPLDTQCQPMIVIANGPGNGITVEHCACIVPGQRCGAIDITQVPG
jgi:hypothetical protein